MTTESLAGTFNEAREYLTRYVYFNNPYVADITVLLVAQHYVLDATDYVLHPRVTSPTIRSGKSRYAKVVGELLPNATRVMDPTSAALLWDLDNGKGTRSFFIDDIQDITNSRYAKNESIIPLLKACAERGIGIPRREIIKNAGAGKTVYYNVGPNPIWLIGTSDATFTNHLIDRMIPVPMVRRNPRNDNIQRWNSHEANRIAEPIRIDIEKLLKSQVEHLAYADPAIPENIADNDRAVEGSRILLALAELAGEGWQERGFNAVSNLLGTRDVTDKAHMLLRDIKTVFDVSKVDRIHTIDLISRLITLCDKDDNTDSPWRVLWGYDWEENYTNGTRHSNRVSMEFSKLLSPFDISSTQMRIGSDNKKGYHRTDFEDAWNRYLGEDDNNGA